MVKREVTERRDRAMMLKHMARHLVSHMTLTTWTNGGFPWRIGTKKGPIKRHHVEMGTGNLNKSCKWTIEGPMGSLVLMVTPHEKPKGLVDKIGSKGEAIIWYSFSFFNAMEPTYKETR